MKSIIVCILLVLTSSVFSQDSTYFNKRRLQTDVFVLSACSPNLISIQRGINNPDKKVNIPLEKLSINVNSFSAFKIENINPLRYQFYINNQSVSQFFDVSDVITGNFIKDTASLQINDIELLQFFKPESVSNTKRTAIDESKAKIKLYQDTLQILNNQLYDIVQKSKEKNLLYDATVDSLKSGNKTEEKKYNDYIDSIDRAYAKQYYKLESELDILGSKLADGNNNAGQLFQDIKRIGEDTNFAAKVGNIPSLLSNEASRTDSNMSQVDKLLNLLPSILSDLGSQNPSKYIFTQEKRKNDSSNTSYNILLDQIKIVKIFAPNKAFIIDELKLLTGNPLERRSEIYKIQEFATDTKIKIAESFVIFASLEIGKLLQSTIVNCSRFQNQISNETCIKDRLSEINVNLQKDNTVYAYIQDICADLNVLINYLELSNHVFDSTVKNINDNYKMLLKFIKTLDFLDKNNTKEYTLPSSANLKNIDLIRYTVERKDKLTGRVESYPYDIWIKGGIKVDFSVAILASQLTDNIFNKNALFTTPVFDSSSGSYLSNQRTDSFYMQKANSGKYNFAFGGMVNLMWRTGSSWVTPGISLGIAYGVETNSKLQFLGAASLQFGKTERLIFHFGIVAGQEQRLDLSQLNYDPRTDLSNEGNTIKVKGDFSTMTAPYNYKFAFKPFFGVSYNLSKKNALNAVGKNADNFNNAFPK